MHVEPLATLPMRVALSLVFAAALAGCATGGVGPSTTAGPALNGGEGRAALRQFLDSAADAPEFRSAQWGLLVVDAGRGETLYARNADKLFMPASNMKLVTGATALTQLGPDYRWTTTVLARGPVRDSVLEGDLVVRGSGDPTVSAHMYPDNPLGPLKAIADSLRARGITRVRGQLVAAPSLFTDSPLGYGWAWDDLDDSYSAGIDALYFNEGFTEVVVYGGARPGDAVRAVTRPAATYPALIVKAQTVARSADTTRNAPHIVLSQDSSRAGVLVTGTIVTGDSVVEEITFRDLPRAYLAALGEAMRGRGVPVFGATVPADITTRTDSLFTMRSPTLREVMPYLEKPSQNQIAEILFKTLAVVKTGAGRADSAASLVSRQLLAWGAAPDGFAIHDGSGLSRHDYVTPRTLIHVLDAMRRSPEYKTFYDALPIAGVDGTIKNRMKGTAAQGNVHAKTGTLDKARSLSGYVTTADGHLLLFSALCNNYTVPLSHVDAVSNALAIRLASLRLGQ